MQANEIANWVGSVAGVLSLWILVSQESRHWRRPRALTWDFKLLSTKTVNGVVDSYLVRIENVGNEGAVAELFKIVNAELTGEEPVGTKQFNPGDSVTYNIRAENIDSVWLFAVATVPSERMSLCGWTALMPTSELGQREHELMGQRRAWWRRKMWRWLPTPEVGPSGVLETRLPVGKRRQRLKRLDRAMSALEEPGAALW